MNMENRCRLRVVQNSVGSSTTLSANVGFADAAIATVMMLFLAGASWVVQTEVHPTQGLVLSQEAHDVVRYLVSQKRRYSMKALLASHTR